VLAAIAGFIVNFFAVEPLLAFSTPTLSEAVNVALNFGAAYLFPIFFNGEAHLLGLAD
jgi:hypothetical protein